LAADDGDYKVVFRDAPIAMIIASLDCEMLEVNSAFVEMLGYESAEEVLAHGTFQALAHSDDRGDDRDLLRRTLAGDLPGYEHENRYVCASGESVWVSLAISVVHDELGVPRLLVGKARDVTERRAAQEALEASQIALARQATRDALTGLPNRDYLIGLIDGIEADDPGYALLFLDLDRFKLVNDSLGHAAGDQLLLQVAARLRSAARARDLVVRFGGDEFVVLMREADNPRAAVALAARLARALEEPFFVEGRSCFVTASVGIACGAGDRRAHDVIADADTAMYRAKERGRGEIAVFDSRMQRAVRERHEIETALRYAVLRDEFALHYQPILTIGERQTVGYEALLRWRRPGGALVHAPEFVPVAEDTGLIGPIGRWVAREAARQLTLWSGGLGMSINVSAAQLIQPDLALQLAHDIELSSVPAGALTLEITESVLLGSVDTALANLSALRELGVRIALDDFGTGYSSLTYLKRFPLDVIKIDRSFAQRINTDPHSAAIVRMIVELADSLGHQVIAEGVETEAQLAALERAGCHMAQGFLFSEPLAPAKIPM
jgi:diguanylate cyclase (GGDEF)-like protein/PAS domain S-box-containing protein